jgi:hypothetical protein
MRAITMTKQLLTMEVVISLVAMDAPTLKQIITTLKPRPMTVLALLRVVHWKRHVISIRPLTPMMRVVTLVHVLVV